MSLVKILTAEYQNNKDVYNLIINFYSLLQSDDWIKNYILWELELFKILGYDLELKNLVVKIAVDNKIQYTSKSKTVWDDAIIEASRRPAVWAIWIIGINLAASVASKAAGSELQDLISLVNRASIIFLCALFLINLIKRVERNLTDIEYTS